MPLRLKGSKGCGNWTLCILHQTDWAAGNVLACFSSSSSSSLSAAALAYAAREDPAGHGQRIARLSRSVRTTRCYMPARRRAGTTTVWIALGAFFCGARTLAVDFTIITHQPSATTSTSTLDPRSSSRRNRNASVKARVGLSSHVADPFGFLENFTVFYRHHSSTAGGDLFDFTPK